jgi:hypothetical protein
MHSMPINVQLISTRPMYTSRRAYSFSRMVNPLQALLTALPLCLRTFILRLTSLLQFMDQPHLSGALLNHSSCHQARLLRLLVEEDGTGLWRRFAILGSHRSS